MSTSHACASHRLWALVALIGCAHPAANETPTTPPPAAAEPAPERVALPPSSVAPLVVAVPEHEEEPLPFVWPEETGALPEEVREAIRLRLESARAAGQLRAHGEALGAARALRGFYQARAFFPLWFEDGRLRRQAYSELLAAIRDASTHGLDPADYHLATIDALPRRLAEATTEELAGADLLLTEAFLTLGDHLQSGKVDPVRVHPSWNIERRRRDLLLELRAAMAEDRVAETLAGLAPAEPRYQALRRALARYRAIAEAGGWPEVTPPARASRWGGATERTLQARLSASGDLSTDGGDLGAALRAFQSRVGMQPTGALDEDTLAALSVPVDQRIDAIEASLERWRWLPEGLGERYLLVNIADFRLQLVEAGETTLEMRAVVGRPYRSTPVFSGLIRYLVLNPSWTAPRTIVREDLLPDLQREGAPALERRGIELFTPQGRRIDPASVRWESVRPTAVPYVFRQPPGPNNALGPVKFMFPNAYDVYLHGTSRQDLFDAPNRAFSSGCVRLERPLELADKLLDGDPRWSRARIDEAVAGGQTRSVSLRRPVPVHVLYWTAWVDGQGRARFRPDVYERDAALRAALGRERPEVIPVASVATTSSSPPS